MKVIQQTPCAHLICYVFIHDGGRDTTNLTIINPRVSRLLVSSNPLSIKIPTSFFFLIIHLYKLLVDVLLECLTKGIIIHNKKAEVMSFVVQIGLHSVFVIVSVCGVFDFKVYFFRI